MLNGHEVAASPWREGRNNEGTDEERTSSSSNGLRGKRTFAGTARLFPPFLPQRLCLFSEEHTWTFLTQEFDLKSGKFKMKMNFTSSQQGHI